MPTCTMESTKKASTAANRFSTKLHQSPMAIALDLIYLDNNATTMMLPEVVEAMRPFLTDVFGNPASAHQHGRRARKALEDARERIAGLLGAHPDEVIFTSGATEANNLAILGLAGDPPGHILASPIEHPCVVEP